MGLALAVAGLGAWTYRALSGRGADADAIWSEAQADLKSYRIDRAEQAVARLGRLRAPTPLDRMLRGQLALALRQPDEALAELARVPDDHYMAAQARLLAGQVEIRRDRFRFAEQALREAVRLDPKLVQAHRELILIYGFQLRRPELAGEFLMLSGLVDLGFGDLLHWGLCQDDYWEPDGAARMLERCVAADRGDRWSRLALSEIKRRVGSLGEAEEALEGLAPDDPQTIAAYARIAIDRDDTARAERLLATARPDDPTAARLRGRLALSRRDAGTALRHFRIAYEAQPDSRDVLSGLIAALTMLGDARALEPLRALAARRERLHLLILRAYSAATRDDPDLAIGLGDACADLHRDAEARGWYQLAIARNPLDSAGAARLFQLGAAAKKETRP